MLDATETLAAADAAVDAATALDRHLAELLPRLPDAPFQLSSGRTVTNTPVHLGALRIDLLGTTAEAKARGRAGLLRLLEIATAPVPA
jgi:hypothetical protein